MKRIMLIVCAAILLNLEANYGQIFSQNFNSSTVLTDYYSASPGTNQFRIIDTTNRNSIVSVSSNTLVFSKNADATTQAYAERNVDFAIIPSGMKLQFNFSVSGGNAATSAIIFYVGADVSNSSGVPANSTVYAKFSINTTSNSGEFKIRNLANLTNGASTFTGMQTISWYLNNTGSTQSYTAPDNSTESIANDKADIWVGSIKEFDDINVTTPTSTLARFKILTSAWLNGTIFTIDDIVINDETALPVQLTSFTALLIDEGVKLDWATATEINNYGFEILRSSHNDKWEKIAFVQGHGNSNSVKNYSFLDKVASAGKVRYRLKQIDFDGKFQYSDFVEVNIKTSTELVLYQNMPNPFNPTTEIAFELPNKSNVELSVCNLLGEKIQTLIKEIMPSGKHKVSFNAKNLPSGVYLYVLNTEKTSIIKKMVLIK